MSLTYSTVAPYYRLGIIISDTLYHLAVSETLHYTFYVNIYTTLQYSHEGSYIYRQLRPNGLTIFNGDDAFITGLSKNLRKCDIK